MRFTSSELDTPLPPQKRAELEAVAAAVEAEIPAVQTTGTTAPFHTALAARALMHTLRGVRAAQGVTLDELATRSGVDKAYLSRLETGKQENVTFVTVERLARALNKRVEFTLVDDE